MEEYQYAYDFGGQASRNSSFSDNESELRNDISKDNVQGGENTSDCTLSSPPQVNSPENSRIQDLERFMESQLSNVINKITCLGNSIQSVNSQLQRKFESVEKELYTVKSKLSQIENPDPEIQFNHNIHRNSIVTNTQQSNMHTDKIGDDQETASSRNVNQSMHTVYEIAPNYRAMSPGQHGGNLKMKPKPYNGEEDLQDFLTQFEITAEINGWGYSQKSLYLASSLTGGARSLLSEMNERERRDFNSLEEKLKARFGSENKAEVFRTQLKTRTRGKNETIPEMAQSIRKMTRQAYPTASQDVIEALALDNFIDALNDSDIRLRLREIAPKNIFEAEKTAVRMEAHRLADRQRSKLVCTLGSTEKSQIKLDNDIPEVDQRQVRVESSSERHDKGFSQNNNWKKPVHKRMHDQYYGTFRTGNNRSNYQNRFNKSQTYRNANTSMNGNKYRNNENFSQNGKVLVSQQGKSRFNSNMQGNDKVSSWGDRSSTM
ncbi:uncharacterized protein LOC132753887 [Ruditapes philippinarum]|uniref:uncharacterized protein LOC132753887 n=1 Tax=Ruditapes philippinarum TaxID=129788 RepID=UPI00295B6E23|nr:uncharacterized protein LOC132753887 [Ruditapes philippinarum]